MHHLHMRWVGLRRRAAQSLERHTAVACDNARPDHAWHGAINPVYPDSPARMQERTRCLLLLLKCCNPVFPSGPPFSPPSLAVYAIDPRTVLQPGALKQVV